MLKHAWKFGARDALKKESIRIQAARARGETTGTSARKIKFNMKHFLLPTIYSDMTMR